MFTRRYQGVCVVLLGLLLCSGSNVLQAHFGQGPRLDIWDMTENADFVFKGKVRSIQYRNSDTVALLDQTGAPIFDEENNQVFVTTSDMPHTFVTYDVVEIFRGSLPVGGPSTLTLRFMGGLSTNPNDPDTVAVVSAFPLFDLDDTDFLYVHGNTNLACPLMNCELGRLRVLLDPADPTQTLRVYEENGFEIVHLNQPQTLREQNIGLGPFHEIPDVLTHEVGNSFLEMLGEGNEVNDFLDPNNFNPDDPAPEPSIVLGPHFTETDFTQFMRDVAGAMPAFTGPPVVSADPSQSFRPFAQDPIVDDGQVFTAQEPEEFVAPDRPWLALLPPEELALLLADEEAERLLVEEAGGDPVIPETPCEQQLIGVARIVADISGPEGKPDCRVDLFDFGELARLYLTCNDPDDPFCL